MATPPPAALLQGTLDVLVLKTLSWGPRHGYAIARWIEESSGDALRIEEGSLYPALYRMERKGWIEAEWGLSESKREVKFYRLTAAGRARLRLELAQWREFSAAVAKVCFNCKKGPAFGHSRSHSMVATKRRFNPNLQKVRIVENGAPKRAYVCTRCLKAGKVTKAR